MSDEKPVKLFSTTGKPSHEMSMDLAQKIKDAIYEYDGLMTLPAAIGVLEIVKFELLVEHETED